MDCHHIEGASDSVDSGTLIASFEGELQKIILVDHGISQNYAAQIAREGFASLAMFCNLGDTREEISCSIQELMRFDGESTDQKNCISSCCASRQNATSWRRCRAQSTLKPLSKMPQCA
jgi:hypothetical protein